MEATRRGVLVGGGVGIGLIVAWGIWPRHHLPNLVAGPGESRFGAWVKIGSDGRVVVAVPQVEHGQGSLSALAQIVADELGADWRTVGVEAAPLNPLYANPLALAELWEEMVDHRAGLAPELTAASTSIRMFTPVCRLAAASARTLLIEEAAARWAIAPAQCRAEAGFVVSPRGRLRFAELAAAAALREPPQRPSLGTDGAGRLMGRPMPRLDAPAKVDGSAAFAGDVRLPDMVHVAIRQGPPGDTRLVAADHAAAERVRGTVAVVENPRWVAVAATTQWAAQRALDALAPRFATRGAVADSAAIAHALDAALARPGERLAGEGDVDALLAGADTLGATYRAAPGVHAAIETPAAAARWADGRLELWVSTQAPGLARAAAARSAGISEDRVALHPMPVGGGFGRALEQDAVEQAAVLAVSLKRPVSLIWTRGEDLLHDAYRAPAVLRLAARLAPGGAVAAWRCAVATPRAGAALARRLLPGAATELALLRSRGADAYALGGAVPPYRLPAFAIDHHPADLPLRLGHVRGGAHTLSCFATESFVDELAHRIGAEPMSYRIGMLGGAPRLARCLTTATALGGWDGGVAGSGQGIAIHRFRGSHIAVLAEVVVEAGTPRVTRLVAAVDCGRIVNPALVRQQIEGGLIFGLAAAMGAATGFTRGLADARGFDTLVLPRLADTPDVTVELIASDEPSGGVSELAVPPVAPALANALAAANGGRRARTLPVWPGR